MTVTDLHSRCRRFSPRLVGSHPSRGVSAVPSGAAGRSAQWPATALLDGVGRRGGGRGRPRRLLGWVQHFPRSPEGHDSGEKRPSEIFFRVHKPVMVLGWGLVGEGGGEKLYGGCNGTSTSSTVH